MADGPGIPFGSAGADFPRDRRERLRRSRGRRFFRASLAAFFLLALALGVAARLAAVGLPRAWSDAIARALSTDDFAVELERVSFSLASMRLRIGEARLYAKGALLPPIAEARGTAVVLRPRLARPGPDWIRSVEVESFSLPEVPDLPDDGNDSPPAALPDLGPVDLHCVHADVLGLRAFGLRSRMTFEGGALLLSDGRLFTGGPGEPPRLLEGTFRLDPAAYAFSSEGSGHLDPNRLRELLRRVGEPEIGDEIAKFEFPDAPPHVVASWRYAPGANERMLRIELSCGPARYNGVPVSGFSGTIVVDGDGGWRRVAVDGLRVDRPEGSVDGRLEILPRAHTISFQAMSTMDPLRVVAMLGVLDADELWRFPVFLLEAIAAVVFLILLLRIRTRRDGTKALLFLGLYAALQTFLESIRIDLELRWGFVKINQLLALPAMALIIAICILRTPREERSFRRFAAPSAGILLCCGVIMAMEFALESKIKFLTWMRMDLCWMVMLAAAVCMAVCACRLIMKTDRCGKD